MAPMKASNINWNFYKQNGYLVAKNVIDHQLLDAIIDKFYLLINNGLSHDNTASIQNVGIDSLDKSLKELAEKNISSYFSASNMLTWSPEILQLFSSPSLIQLLKQLNLNCPTLVSKLQTHIQSDYLSKEIDKIGGYYLFEQHQDWRSGRGSLDALTTWVPLHNVYSDNYTVEVIPGSHLRGLIDSEPDKNGIFYLSKDHKYPDSNFERLEISKGDVLILSAFIVHRSGINKTPNKTRLAVGARFNNCSEKSFIKRGYPSPYKTSVNLEMKKADEPSAKQIKELFT